MKRFFRVSRAQYAPVEIMHFVLPVVGRIMASLLREHTGTLCSTNGLSILVDVLRRLKCEDAMWCFLEDWLQTNAFAELMAHSYFHTRSTGKDSLRVSWPVAKSDPRDDSLAYPPDISLTLSPESSSGIDRYSVILGSDYDHDNYHDVDNSRASSAARVSGDLTRPEGYDPLEELSTAKCDSMGKWDTFVSICWTARVLNDCGFDIGSTGFDLQTLTLHLLQSVLRYGAGVLLDASDSSVRAVRSHREDTDSRQPSSQSSIGVVDVIDKAHFSFRVLQCVGILADSVNFAATPTDHGESGLHSVFFNFMHVFHQAVVSSDSRPPPPSSSSSSSAKIVRDDVRVVEDCMRVTALVMSKLFKKCDDLDSTQHSTASISKPRSQTKFQNYLMMLKNRYSDEASSLATLPATSESSPWEAYTLSSCAFQEISILAQLSAKRE
jgi:hypothetical protein